MTQKETISDKRDSPPVTEHCWSCPPSNGKRCDDCSGYPPPREWGEPKPRRKGNNHIQHKRAVKKLRASELTEEELSARRTSQNIRAGAYRERKVRWRMTIEKLGADKDGFFALRHDVTDDQGGVFATGSEMKLLGIVTDGDEMQVRIRPKHHQEGDGFTVPLKRLL